MQGAAWTDAEPTHTVVNPLSRATPGVMQATGSPAYVALIRHGTAVGEACYHLSIGLRVDVVEDHLVRHAVLGHELRAAMESRAQVLEESRGELRARAERAERDLDAARALLRQ